MGFKLKSALGGLATGIPGAGIIGGFTGNGSSGLTSFLGGQGASWSNLSPGGILDDLTGRRNMREQNEWNLQMWNLQNAYNTPAAQMQRFMDAGLNPNLIYGQSNTAGPVHASASAEGLGGALSKVSSAFQTIMGMKQMAAQIKNMKEQNLNLQAQNSLTNSQTDFVNEQVRRYAWETQEMKRRGVVPGISSTPERMIQYVGSKYNPLGFLMKMLGSAYGSMTNSHPYESPAQKWYYNGAGNYSGVRL